MLKFEMVEVTPTPYLYEERSCSIDPEDISRNMGEVFQNVWKFAQANGVTSLKQGIAVYYTYDPDQMTFRAGFTISGDETDKADGTIKSETLPAGKVLTFTHIGPYAKLRDSYSEMMKYVAENNLTLGAPTWELYVNDPSVTPSEELRTDVYVTLS